MKSNGREAPEPIVNRFGFKSGAAILTVSLAALLNASPLSAAGLGIAIAVPTIPQATTTLQPDETYLRQTLINVYRQNYSLQASRANADAVNNRTYGAVGQWLPSVTLQGTMAAGKATVGDKSGSDKPTTMSVTVTQPIWRPNLLPGILAANNTDNAEKNRLINAEQQALLNGVTVYFNLAQTSATLELQVSNEHLLTKQLEAVEQQFNIGTVTGTEVAQARSALQAAVAQRSAAAAAFKAAQASYLQVVQSAPPPSPPVPLPEKYLPKSEEDALNLAIKFNPLLRAADYDSQAASNQEFAAWASLGPSVNLVGSYSENRGINPSNASAGSQTTKTTQIMGTVTLPLWDSGVTYSAIAAQRQVAKAARFQYQATLAAVTQQVVASFGQLESTREQVKAFDLAIKANSFALMGTREEVQIGTKTILDLLNAEQALLNSQVSLVQAQYRLQLAAYQVLAATGALTASALNLEVGEQ
ncbi:MAG: TolC family protein [Candidatus Pacebacteria bacterium]|nr:TolC family protein [Candidatus Paceibacterota bacterium]